MDFRVPSRGACGRLGASAKMFHPSSINPGCHGRWDLPPSHGIGNFSFCLLEEMKYLTRYLCLFYCFLKLLHYCRFPGCPVE